MKKIVSLVLSVVFVLSLVACSNVSTSSNGYKTSGEWAMYDSNYMFAVEVDEYNGDVFQAGTYEFKLSAGRSKAASGGSQAVLPGIFDVYVGNKEYKNIAEMKQDIPDPQITVGGMGSNDTTTKYELVAGQYVYIIPFEMDYQPSGYVSFKLSK